MDYLLHLLIQWSIFSVVSLGQQLILGRAGMLVVMQASIFGLSAYATALLAIGGTPPVIALCGGSLVAVVAGLVLTFPVLGLRSDYLLLSTLGICEILRSILNNSTGITGGAAGLMGIPNLTIGGYTLDNPAKFAPFAFGLALIFFWLFWSISASPFGILLTAIREDMSLMSSFGKDVTAARISAITVGFFASAVSGGTWAFYVGYLNPASFSMWESIAVLTMVILGGIRRFEGAFLGSGAVILVSEMLRFVNFAGPTALAVRQVLFGLSLLIIFRFRNEGVLRESSL